MFTDKASSAYVLLVFVKHTSVSPLSCGMNMQTEKEESTVDA